MSTSALATDSGLPKVSIRTLANVFLRLGATSFGGPAAHIALMEDELVRRRAWLTHAEFLDLLGATNLIPGPNSTEMAIHIGHRVAGWRGLVVAGACFILPSAVMVAILAWVYVAYHQLPAVTGILYGVKPVVIAIVLQALWRLGRSALRTPLLIAAAAAGTALSAIGIHELVVLFGVGFAVPVLRGFIGRVRAPRASSFALFAFPTIPAAGAAVAATPVGLWPMFLFFLKVGSVLFGSGYVLLAFLRADLVERYGWLSEQQLLDAIAIGQVTPGPVSTAATFIGFVLAGPGGAAIATAGIFLPAFVFVALSVPLLPRLRRSPVAGAFLDGVNAASLALMAVVTVQLGRAALIDWLTVAVTAASAVALFTWRVNATWLVLGGAVIGLGRSAILGG